MLRSALVQHLHRRCPDGVVPEEVLANNGRTAEHAPRHQPPHKEIIVQRTDKFDLELRELSGLGNKKPFYARERDTFLNVKRRSDEEMLMLNQIRTELHRERSRRKVFMFARRLREFLNADE